MAGWADSGSSRGRGGGGAGGYGNRGGANNMNTRWRARTPAQNQQQQHQQHQQQHQQHQQQHQQHPQQNLQQQQQHQLRQRQQHQQHQHSYRPVNHNDQSSQHPPAEEPSRHQGQGGFSNSTRRPQQARPASADHKSPAPATNADASAVASEPDDKAKRNAANFECNVCFDMADDPVVTTCGHLFCWECLYQWLHVHSHHRECPVCKGQVADDAIIPIYGRGGSAASVHSAPPRPTAARVESSRQLAVLDDEDDNPFADLFGLQVTSLSAMMGFMSDIHTDDDEYEDYVNPYHHQYSDELDHFDLSHFPVPASAAAGSSRRHFHHTGVSGDITDSFFDNTNHQEPDFVYRGGRRQRGRARGAASADHSNMVELDRGTSLVMRALRGSNSAAYLDTGVGPHMYNTGGSSRPNGGWTERRGRSNRNSNSGGGRGMQNNSRRQGANYN